MKKHAVIFLVFLLGDLQEAFTLSVEDQRGPFSVDLCWDQPRLDGWRRFSEREEAASFDLFDTLVGRIHGGPTSVFRLVEKKSGLIGFYEARILAEQRRPGILKEIYQELRLILGLTESEAEALAALEFEVELANLFPISRNLSLIRDGDVIVTDTYYTKEQVMTILQMVGLTKEVEIFASYGGKHSGAVWPQVLAKKQVAFHFGDNCFADVKSPQEYGITAFLFAESAYSLWENRMVAVGFEELAHLMRYLRLSNPYAVGSFSEAVWLEQAQFNVPVLVFVSNYIHQFCLDEKKGRILFSSRDCLHLFELFNLLYPNDQAFYFYTSRYVYRNPSTDYIDYVRSLYTDGTVIVDGHGSGVSCSGFFKSYLGVEPCFLPISRYGIPYNKLAITCGLGDGIETLNYTREGSLAGFNQSGPVYLDLEYDPVYVEPIYRCMALLREKVKEYTLTGYNQDLVNRMLSHVQENGSCLVKKVLHYVEHNPPVIAPIWEERIRDLPPENESLESLANFYRSDKGSEYVCAHSYTRHYERLFSPLKGLPVSILEIGLNRFDRKDCASLQMWLAYFPFARIVGMDIEKQTFSHPRVSFIEGNQGELASLQKVIASIEAPFDIIIDDGSHASWDQQLAYFSLFPHLKNGGYYIIEDLHYQPASEKEGVYKTVVLLKRILEGKPISIPGISSQTIRKVLSMIESIELLDSARYGPNCFAVIKKK